MGNIENAFADDVICHLRMSTGNECAGHWNNTFLFLINRLTLCCLPPLHVFHHLYLNINSECLGLHRAESGLISLYYHFHILE